MKSSYLGKLPRNANDFRTLAHSPAGQRCAWDRPSSYVEPRVCRPQNLQGSLQYVRQRTVEERDSGYSIRSIPVGTGLDVTTCCDSSALALFT